MSTKPPCPPPAFTFAVWLEFQQQLSGNAVFQEMSSIGQNLSIEECEGGVNSFVHRLPSVTQRRNQVLRRGYFTKASALAQWVDQALGSSLTVAISTQTVNIGLLGPNRQPVLIWTFQNAFPVKFEVSGFDASGTDVLVEMLEFSYTTVRRETVGADSHPAP